MTRDRAREGRAPARPEQRRTQGTAFLPWGQDLRRAFTLLELMVVMLLIAMLMALLLPAFGKMREKALIRRAEMEARALANAIRAYHHEYGVWPGPPTGAAPLMTTSTNPAFMRALAASDVNPPGVNPLKINFIEIPAFTNSDPFRQGHAYRITITPSNNTVTVWSYGPDCTPGGDDDIAVTF